MARTEASQAINRPAQDVSNDVVNPEHDPDWAGIVLEARHVHRPTFTPEGHSTAISKFRGRRMTLNFRMTVKQEPLTLRVESRGGPVPHSWHSTFEPRGKSTRVTVVVDGDPGSCLVLAAPVMMGELQTELLALKTLIEMAVPASRAS